MKPPSFDLLTPASVAEAVQLLAEFGDAAKLLAGGQSLLPSLNLRLASPAALIDLGAITELRGIQVDASGNASIGALTTHRDVERSAALSASHPLLPHAMASVAHVQIRNRGTIGGSLSHADPAAEWAALCLACDARMVAVDGAGSRVIAATDFNLGLFTTALAPSELLVRIELPAWPGNRGWGFSEVARRTGDFAIAGAVALLDMDATGRCTSARVVAFGAGDRAERIRAAEDMLVGQTPDAPLLRQVASAAGRAIEARGDHHASREYRREVLQVVVERALAQAIGRGA